MKVGKLNVFSVCGLFNIVTGPNFFGMLCCWAIVYILFGGVMFYNTIFVAWDKPVQIILWALLSINTLCFLILCIGPTGIPPQILEAARGGARVNTTTVDRTEDQEANKESLLPRKVVIERICAICALKFHIPDKDLGTGDAKCEHCSDCGICILDIDHHCGVFDKCIAAGNTFTFYVFLIAFFGSLAFHFGAFLLN